MGMPAHTIAVIRTRLARTGARTDVGVNCNRVRVIFDLHLFLCFDFLLAVSGKL